jgi:hypothetical protein
VEELKMMQKNPKKFTSKDIEALREKYGRR